MSDFNTQKLLKARKTHRCAECGQAIAPGETYRRDSGVFDGHVWSFKACLPCAALVDWCWGNDVFDHDNGREFGMMLTDLAERDMVETVEVWADNDGHSYEEVRVTEDGRRWLEIDPARNFPRLLEVQS